MSAALEPEEVVEPVRVRAELRLVAEVPLADEAGGVAVVLEQLRQRTAGRGQADSLPGAPAFLSGSLERDALLIAAADQRRARRRAGRRARRSR